MVRYVSKITVLIAILFCAAHLTGCFAVTQSPALGLWYTDAAAPITATSTAPSDKMLKRDGDRDILFRSGCHRRCEYSGCGKECGYHQDSYCRLSFKKHLGDSRRIYRDCVWRIGVRAVWNIGRDILPRWSRPNSGGIQRVSHHS